MTAANWRERYTASVLRSCFEYMKKDRRNARKDTTAHSRRNASHIQCRCE
jgi:hypothetical protein